MDRLKTDAEYNYQVELTPDRDMPKGHRGFGFTPDDTEVEALQKILNGYIDASTPDKAIEFSNHKMEFSITFLDSFILILTDKKSMIQAYYDEVEKQLEAVNHRMIKPHVEGRVLSMEEKLELYDIQEKLLIQRRSLKDTVSALRVNIENLEKSRNFILGMNQRKYTPKTDRFKNDDNYQLGKVPRETSVAPRQLVETERDTTVSRVLTNGNKLKKEN